MKRLLTVLTTAALIAGGSTVVSAKDSGGAGAQTYTALKTCLEKQVAPSGKKFKEGVDFRQRPGSADGAGVVQSHTRINTSSEWLAAKKACGVKTAS